VGGYYDNAAVAADRGVGAAWVYTRSNGVWTQQGAKLVGNDAVGPAGQGWSVALSGDGNTAVVGGYYDDYIPGATVVWGVGAAWVYTRSNGVWTQQGSKLVGNDSSEPAGQGWSVALSGDGNTAVVGGVGDNNETGAAWAYTRSNRVWTQQGAKLVGTGAVAPSHQGQSVALSADGNTAIVGGPRDNSFTGAAWVFVQPSPSLQVTPISNMVAAGNPGGPFAPVIIPIPTQRERRHPQLFAFGRSELAHAFFDVGQCGLVWNCRDFYGERNRK
jgi:hypothetical protein